MLGLEMILLFVLFGLLVGTLFGFFGMGGSFLITPALLILDYPSDVAVGSGMAFVFGTAVIAAIKHRELGQVDYKLGVAMIAGTAAGIEIGKEVVFYLKDLGLAENVIGVSYVVLLGGIGVFTTWDAIKNRGKGSVDLHDEDAEVDDLHPVAKKLQSWKVPPMLNLQDGVKISLWAALIVGLVTGLLSGFLGVGGGFIRMPALVYGLGIPVPIAIGTDLFEIVFSGGIGTWIYALEGSVNLGIVAPLLAGSALGAILGAKATSVVDTEEIKVTFGAMLLGGAAAVAARQLSQAYGIAWLNTVSLVLIFGSALVVTGVIALSVFKRLRERKAAARPAAG